MLNVKLLPPLALTVMLPSVEDAVVALKIVPVTVTATPVQELDGLLVPFPLLQAYITVAVKMRIKIKLKREFVLNIKDF